MAVPAGDGGGGGVRGPRHVVLPQRRVPAGHRRPRAPPAPPARRPPPAHPAGLPLRPLPPPLGLPLLRLARRPRRRLAGRWVPPAGAPRLAAVRGGAGGAARGTGPRRPARPRAPRRPHAQRAQGDTARLPVGPAGDRVPRQAAPQEPQDGAGRPGASGGAARGLRERRVRVLAMPALAEGAPAVRVRERRPLVPWRAALGAGAGGEAPAQECAGVARGTENLPVLGGHCRLGSGNGVTRLSAVSTSGTSATLLSGMSNLWVGGNHAKVHSLPHNLQQATEIWSGIVHVETEIHLQWSSCTVFIDGMSCALT